MRKPRVRSQSCTGSLIARDGLEMSFAGAYSTDARTGRYFAVPRHFAAVLLNLPNDGIIVPNLDRTWGCKRMTAENVNENMYLLCALVGCEWL